jgi:SOS response regulatory protein OraA/RecX
MVRVVSEKTSTLNMIGGGTRNWPDHANTKSDSEEPITEKRQDGQCSIEQDCSTASLAIDPSDFNFTHVLRYFKNHVDPKTFLAARNKVDAMIDEGLSAVQIRHAMTDEECIPLFLEAILIGQSKQFVKTNAMIEAGIEPKKIFHHMTEEGGDPELVRSIIEAGTDHKFGTILSDSTSLRDRDPRAFRAVSDLVSTDLAVKMKRVGVPEGGIRQKLARSGIGSENIESIMCKVNEEEEASLRRKTSAASRRIQHSHYTNDSENDADDDEDYFSDSSCEDEEDPTLQLRTAVLRRIKDMAQYGKSDAEIREKLIAMKCVDRELVDCFLDQVYPKESSQEPREGDPRKPEARTENEMLPNKILIMYRAGVPKEKIEERVLSHSYISRKELETMLPKM